MFWVVHCFGFIVMYLWKCAYAAPIQSKTGWVVNRWPLLLSGVAGVRVSWSYYLLVVGSWLIDCFNAKPVVQERRDRGFVYELIKNLPLKWCQKLCNAPSSVIWSLLIRVYNTVMGCVVEIIEGAFQLVGCTIYALFWCAEKYLVWLGGFLNWTLFFCLSWFV